MYSFTEPHHHIQLWSSVCCSSLLIVVKLVICMGWLKQMVYFPPSWPFHMFACWFCFLAQLIQLYTARFWWPVTQYPFALLLQKYMYYAEEAVLLPPPQKKKEQYSYLKRKTSAASSSKVQLVLHSTGVIGDTVLQVIRVLLCICGQVWLTIYKLFMNCGISWLYGMLIHIILNSFCYELSLINSLVKIINTQVDYMTLKKHWQWISGYSKENLIFCIFEKVGHNYSLFCLFINLLHFICGTLNSNNVLHWKHLKWYTGIQKVKSLSSDWLRF